jgi:paraquat-inducible protein A
MYCHTCGLLVRPRSGGACVCPRCGQTLHWRKPDSLARTWAFLVAAAILYLPANLLPVMATTSFGETNTDTIMSGVIYFFRTGSWLIALIIFVASICVPLVKIVVLTGLLISVQRRSNWRPRERTRLYRVTEVIGRWSMVDVFAVTVLVALVRMGGLATVEAEVGVVFFASVVVLTMFAAMSFDPRLIWDAMEVPADGR